MKKINVFLCAAVVAGMSLTSCSKDDDGFSVSEEQLVGKWNFKTEQVSAMGISAPEDVYFDNETGCSEDFITLNADGTATWGDYQSGCTLTTTTTDWDLNGNNVTMTVDGSAKKFTVESISATTMKAFEEEQFEGGTMRTTYTFQKAAAN